VEGKSKISHAVMMISKTQQHSPKEDMDALFLEKEGVYDISK